jgi:hypothetical protein
MGRFHSESTESFNGKNQRIWSFFVCGSCGGSVMAVRMANNNWFHNLWPPVDTVSVDVPERARMFLQQAISSLHTPSGAIMLTASSVDAMLKKKGYTEGSLDARIKTAAEDHLITAEMAEWAHEVRLDANSQRHADEGAPLPDEADAKRSIEFAKALAQFLFVLPAMVASGRKMPKGATAPASQKTAAPAPPVTLR